MKIAIFNPSTEYIKDGKTKIAYDNKVKQLDMPWDSVVELLMGDPEVNDKKINVDMISGWEYLPPNIAVETVSGFTRKVKCNLLSISLVIVDYDDEIFMSDFLDKYPDMEYVIYTSFSHHTDLNYDKFRVVIPLQQPVCVDQWARMENGLLEYFTNCDKTSFAQNRSFFLPHTTQEMRNNYVAYHHRGKWFDGSIIPLQEEVVYKPIVSDIKSSKTGTGKVLWNTLDVVGLFQQQGLYEKKDARNRHLVRCPWESEHSSDTSGTAIWEAVGNSMPGFNCIHHHCHGKKLYDVTQKFKDAAHTFCEREEQDLTKHKNDAVALIKRLKEKQNDRN